jgi:hypothetical protein
MKRTFVYLVCMFAVVAALLAVPVYAANEAAPDTDSGILAPSPAPDGLMRAGG